MDPLTPNAANISTAPSYEPLGINDHNIDGRPVLSTHPLLYPFPGKEEPVQEVNSSTEFLALDVTRLKG